ncbi:MAG TPA: T9SS type B sorting domain-containing protein, partial [Bacteroidetes bacterium]|nr:T9SS type B sorting domain-containing protein [Bacteroidota bacterium]
ADFSFSDSFICEYFNINFTDLSTHPSKWEWSLTNNHIYNNQNPSHIYTQAGTYNIELNYADVNGCRDTFLHPTSIIVNPIPDVDFTSDTLIGCEGLSVNFFDQSVSDTSLLTWLWSFTDYQTSTLQNPVFTFDTAKNYDISLEVVNAKGCASDTIKSAYISITRPSSDFAGHGSLCFGDTVFLSQTNYGLNQSLNSTYSWDLGDSTFTNDIAPIHYYTNYGIYPVTFIVTDTNTCSDTTNRNIYIQQVAAKLTSLSPTYKNCPPLFVNFADSSISYINYWEWDFGDNSPKSYLQHPIHNYIYADTFDVQLIVKSSGTCWDTILMKDFIIVDGPYAEVNYGPHIGCKPLAVTFNIMNEQNVNNFFYDFADGTNFGTGDTTIHYYDQVGTFYPSLWISDSLGCSYFFPSYDSVFIEPVKADFSVGTPNEGCRPLNTTFSDLSINATSWQWDFGDGDTDSIQNTSHNFDSSGNFNVTLIIIDSVTKCTDTLIRENAIDVYELYAIITADTLQGCSPFSINFNDNSTSESFVTKWAWDFGTGFFDSTPIPPDVLFSNTIDTSYTVELWIEDNEGCQDSTQLIIDLNLYPKVAFTTDTNISCPGMAISFSNLTIADSGSIYTWHFGDSLTSDRIHPFHTYWENGFYDITLNVITPAGCDSTLKIDSFLYILSRPKITISGGQALTINETAQLFASGGITYSWTPQTGLNDPYIPNPVADPDDTTIYVVSVIDTNNCENKDSLTLIVTIPEEPLALIPDAFSPNGDGQNDYLTIIDYDIETLSYFKVYNRWGQLLFETNSLSNGWDGTYKGEPQDMGTYIYLIVGYSKLGKKIIKKGDITLIR